MRRIVRHQLCRQCDLSHVRSESSVHTSNGEHIIFQLEGEVEFKHGNETFHLEKYDMLFIPANYPYEFSNVGMGSAAFLGIAGKVQEWPATSTYEDI